MGERIGTRRFTVFDLAAVLCGAAILAYFLLTIRYSVGMPDEIAYNFLGQRLSFGDRMISDEWDLAQFTVLPTLPLYFLYTALRGSTQGLVFFMRHVFLATDLLFYAYMYKKLRRFRAAGLIASVMFCAMLPQTFLAFSYCTISSMAIMSVCLELFFDETQKSRLRFFLIGLALALAVLEDPFLVVLYLIWAVFVLIRALRGRKRKPFFPEMAYMLENRAFLMVTLACAVMLAAFFAVLIWNRAFEDLGSVLPYLFTGNEYNAGNLISANRILSALQYFGLYFVAGLSVCLAASGVMALLKIKNRYASLAVFGSAIFLLCACYACAALKTVTSNRTDYFIMFTQYHCLPLVLFSPVPFLLSPRWDKKRASALVTGLLYSVLMDIPGKSYIGIGGFMLHVPLALQMNDLLRFLFFEDPAGLQGSELQGFWKKNAKKVIFGAVAAGLCVCVAWDLAYIGGEGVYKAPEKLFLNSSDPLDYKITKGPYRGLVTTETIGRIYESTLSDLDIIREDPDCAVTVLDVAPFAYFYLDRPYASFSCVYNGELDRLIAYWELPFTRKPDYIYIPYYNYFLYFRYSDTIQQKQLDTVMQYVSADVIHGKAGFILCVRD